MHDAKGQDIKVGDVVLIPCKVREVYHTPDFCNVQVQTLGGRSPDGGVEIFSLNSKQVIRANEGDNTTFSVVEDEGKAFLR